MFRASSAHLQDVNDVNCTCMQPLVFSFSAGVRILHLYQVGINKGIILRCTAYQISRLTLLLFLPKKTVYTVLKP